MTESQHTEYKSTWRDEYLKWISNKDYQEINNVSKRTASSELSHLANDFKILVKSDSHGAGVYYTIIGQ